MPHFRFPFAAKPNPFRDEFSELRAALPEPTHYVEFRMSRTLLIALIVSALVHLIVMLWVHLRMPPVTPASNNGSQAPLSVQLNPMGPLTSPAPPAPAAHIASITHPTSHPQHVSHRRPPSMPHILVAPGGQKTPHTISIPVPKPSPELPPKATDMSSYINMIREKNHTEQNEESGGGGGGSSSQDARTANIQRNLQDQGGGGIFQITRMDESSASFIFRGWSHATWTSPSNQTFTVEATDNVDIQHAIIRKMIAIIRQTHKGDIEWDSYRLGQTVTMSARPENNAELEEFLLKEFFYDNRR